MHIVPGMLPAKRYSSQYGGRQSHRTAAVGIYLRRTTYVWCVQSWRLVANGTGINEGNRYHPAPSEPHTQPIQLQHQPRCANHEACASASVGLSYRSAYTLSLAQTSGSYAARTHAADCTRYAQTHGHTTTRNFTLVQDRFLRLRGQPSSSSAEQQQ